MSDRDASDHDDPTVFTLDHSSDVFLFCIGCSVCVFSLCFTVFLIYALKKNHSKDSYTSTYPTTFAACTFYILSSIIYLLAMPHLDIRNHSNLENDQDLVLCALFFVLFLIMARLSICAQFVIRIRTTFKSTPAFALRRRTLTVSVTLSVLVFITVVWWSVLIIIRYLAMRKVGSESTWNISVFSRFKILISSIYSNL